MKWNTAINKIEKALAAGSAVSVRYHRKWMLQQAHIDKVESVNEYAWEGQICKAVSTYYDLLDEGSHMIDEVIIGKEGK